MNTFFRIALVFVLTWTCQVQLLQGQIARMGQEQTGDTISVVATGIGKDRDEALKSALRAAVEQAVGVLVDAETLVTNDKLVTDKILTFSDGFVQTYEQLGEPRTDSGLVSVRISAKVKRNELNTQLRSAGVIKVPLSGRNLAAEAMTKEMSREDGVEMLVNLLEKFPANIYDHSTTWRYDLDTRKTIIEVETKIDTKKYNAFVKETSDLLLKVGGRAMGSVNNKLVRKEGERGPYGNKQVVPYIAISRLSSSAFEQAKGYHFLIADGWPNLRRVGQENTLNCRAYIVPEEVFKMTRPMFKSRNMTVKAVDSGGNALSIGKTTAPTPGSSARVWVAGYYYWDNSDSNVVVLFPSLFLGNQGAYDFYPGTPEYKQQVPLDIPKEVMERISAVHISIE